MTPPTPSEAAGRGWKTARGLSLGKAEKGKPLPRSNASNPADTNASWKTMNRYLGRRDGAPGMQVVGRSPFTYSVARGRTAMALAVCSALSTQRREGFDEQRRKP